MLPPAIFNYALSNGMDLKDVTIIVRMVTDDLNKKFRKERDILSGSLRKRGLCIRCGEESPTNPLCDDCQV